MCACEESKVARATAEHSCFRRRPRRLHDSKNDTLCIRTSTVAFSSGIQVLIMKSKLIESLRLIISDVCFSVESRVCGLSDVSKFGCNVTGFRRAVSNLF